MTRQVTGFPRPRLRVELLGITLDHLPSDELEQLVEQRLTLPYESPLALGSVNLDHVHHFGRNAAVSSGRSAAVSSARSDELEWLMLIDGVPVARKARRVTHTEWPRLAGADLLPGLLSVAERTGARVGFLGGHESTVAALRARLEEGWPALAIAGFWTPPRPTIDDHAASQDLAATIRAADVHLLVVGLGKPRQESWIKAHAGQTGADVLLAFGAAADFLAGSARRAPEWMRNAGLEWLFRLVQEPRRLARRYLRDGPAALWALWRAPAVVRYDEIPPLTAPAPWSPVLAPLPHS